MPREMVDDKERGKLKRMRRARGGRTLPRSGGGIHEDKKCKKLERELAIEAEEEIRHWDDEDEDDDYIDQDDFIDYYEWKYGERE